MWGAIQWPEGLDAERFLQEYWQKKPLLLRQAFPSKQPGLDANDVAGLAMEDEADSRLIQGRHGPGNQHDGNWSVRHGPFDEEDLTALPARDWTLLVCGLEQWWPPAADMLSAFRFLPDWRIDDLMVSIAGEGGSVGPHVDQYDVFLFQAAGLRHWAIAEQYLPDLYPDLPLAILREFQAQQQWLLEPGDMLYLPPNVAHHGVAQAADETCMTWSIGFRAPSASEWLDKLVEPISQILANHPRYRDPALHPHDPATFTREQSQRLRQLLAPALDDPEQFYRLAAAALTSQPDIKPDPTDYSMVQLISRLQAGDMLRRTARPALLAPQGDDQAMLISDQWQCQMPVALARCLLDSHADSLSFGAQHGARPALDRQALNIWLDQDDGREQILDCLNQGLLEWIDD